VIIDLVATLLLEADEKLELGAAALANGAWSDAIYHAYSSFVQAAKALLLGEGVSGNTQIGIINDFDKYFTATGKFTFDTDFKTTVLQINANEPSEQFAKAYYAQAADFYKTAQVYREKAAQAAPVQA
jgi:sulfite reductase (ferredoxin)